ncbi:MAG: EcsC family protein [Caldilineaceae bacterium]|nr:EcsC family protein [Caldilineaceae bacterium]
MTDFQQPPANKSAAARMVDHLLEQVTTAVDQASVQLAKTRVELMRSKHPEATIDELVQLLVKQKAAQAATVGAVTSGASVIPGLGTLATMTYGVAVDLGLTLKLQAELIAEIAVLHGREMSAVERRHVLLAVTGLNLGAEKLAAATGKRIAQKASARFAQSGALKAIPFLGIAASAGANGLTTYMVGQRAHAYFGLGPEAVGDWAESMRALTGIDDRQVKAWLTATGSSSLQALRQRAQSVGRAAGARASASRRRLTDGQTDEENRTSNAALWLERWRNRSVDTEE